MHMVTVVLMALLLVSPPPSAAASQPSGWVEPSEDVVNRSCAYWMLRPPYENVVTALAERDRVLWIGTSRAGVGRLSLDKDTLLSWTALPGEDLRTEVKSIVFTAEGRALLRCGVGVVEMDASGVLRAWGDDRQAVEALYPRLLAHAPPYYASTGQSVVVFYGFEHKVRVYDGARWRFLQDGHGVIEDAYGVAQWKDTILVARARGAWDVKAQGFVASTSGLDLRQATPVSQDRVVLTDAKSRRYLLSGDGRRVYLGTVWWGEALVAFEKGDAHTVPVWITAGGADYAMRVLVDRETTRPRDWVVYGGKILPHVHPCGWAVLGVHATTAGEMWVATSDGATLFRQGRPMRSLWFNLGAESLDEKRRHVGPGAMTFIETSDGRTWFGTYDGVVVWDGKRLRRGKIRVRDEAATIDFREISALPPD